MASLADRLALTRTELAAERTLLAYTRTALALAASGVAIAKFAGVPALIWLGRGLVWTAGFVAAGGVVRFRHVRTTVRALAREVGVAPATADSPER